MLLNKLKDIDLANDNKLYNEFKLKLFLKWINKLGRKEDLDGDGDSDLAVENSLKENNKYNILLNTTGNGGLLGQGKKQEITFRRFKKRFVELINILCDEGYIEDEGLDESKIKNLIEVDSVKLFKDNKKGFSQPSRLLEKWWKIANNNEILSTNMKNKFALIFNIFINITKDNYVKYLENINTLPKLLTSKDDNKNKDKVDDNEIIIEFLLEFINLSTTFDENEEYDICYIRHGDGSRANKNMYKEALSGSQSYFNQLNEFQYEKNYYFRNKLLINLLENGIIKMLIVDERVRNYFDNNYEFKSNYINSRIYIPGVIIYEFKVKNTPVVSISEEVIVPSKISEIDDNNHIIFAGDHKNIDNGRYDVLIIHQGILEKLKGSSSKDIGKFLKDIKKDIPFVIVTSGRGVPSNLPEYTKYLSFSNIDSLILKPYHEKLLLTQLVMKTGLEADK